MFELFVKLLTHSATSAMSVAVTSIYGVIVLLPIIYLNYKRPWFQALLFITAAGSVVAAVQHVLDVVQVRQERSVQADQAKKSQQEAIGLLKELQEKADRYTANKDKSVKVSAGLSIKGKRVSSHASQKGPQKRVKSSKKRNKKLKKGDKLGNALQKLGKKIEDRDKKDRRSKLISWIWWGVKKVIIIAAIVFIIYWLLSYRLSLTKNRGHGGTLSFAQKHIDQKGNIRGNQPRQQEADDGLGLSSPEGLLEKRENPHPVAKNQKNAFLNPKVKEVQTCSTILDADNLSLLAIAWRIDQSNLPRFVWAHQTLERGIQKGEFSEKDLSLFYEKKGDLLLPNEKMEQVEAEGEVINNGDKIRSIQDYRREEEYKRKAKARRKQFEDRLHQRRRKREQKSVKESKISEKERRDKAKERLFDRKRRLEEMKKREKLEAEICKKKKEEHKKRSEKIQKRKEKEQKKRKRQHQKKHKEALKRRLEYSFNPNKRAALSFFNDEKEREEAEEGLGDLRIQEDELLKLLKELVHKKDGLISNRVISHFFTYKNWHIKSIQVNLLNRFSDFRPKKEDSEVLARHKVRSLNDAVREQLAICSIKNSTLAKIIQKQFASIFLTKWQKKHNINLLDLPKKRNLTALVFPKQLKMLNKLLRKDRDGEMDRIRKELEQEKIEAQKRKEEKKRFEEDIRKQKQRPKKFCPSQAQRKAEERRRKIIQERYEKEKKSQAKRKKTEVSDRKKQAEKSTKELHSRMIHVDDSRNSSSPKDQGNSIINDTGQFLPKEEGRHQRKKSTEDRNDFITHGGSGGMRYGGKNDGSCHVNPTRSREERKKRGGKQPVYASGLGAEVIKRLSKEATEKGFKEVTKTVVDATLKATKDEAIKKATNELASALGKIGRINAAAESGVITGTPWYLNFLPEDLKAAEGLKQAAEKKLAEAKAREVTKEITEKVAKDAGKKGSAAVMGKLGGRLAAGVGVEYAFSAAGTTWRCLSGENEAMKECRERCEERKKGKGSLEKFGIGVVNSVEKVGVAVSEIVKDAPPADEVVVRAAGGIAGSEVGAAIGGALFCWFPAAMPVTSFLGGIVGGWFGSSEANKAYQGVKNRSRSSRGWFGWLPFF